jgi:hypothetical protein
MKIQSISRIILHIILLTILVSFEAAFGLPWLSFFFIQQINARSSVVSSWIVIVLMSFLISSAFSTSLLLVFGYLVFLWVYQDIRSRFWWIIYFLIVISTSIKSFGYNYGFIALQTIFSLVFLVFYTKGIIWWPKTWKDNEKII